MPGVRRNLQSYVTRAEKRGLLKGQNFAERRTFDTLTDKATCNETNA